MARSEAPLAALAKGAAAGLVGTAALTVAMHRTPEALNRLGLTPADPRVPKTREQAAETQEKPTRELAGRVARGALGTSLAEDTRAATGRAIH